MESAPSLRLVDPEALEPDSYIFDRRTELRQRARGYLTAIIKHDDSEQAGVLRQLCQLELRDRSEHGLGATSPCQIPAGSEVELLIPPDGNESGLELMGQVVRCRAVEGDEENLGRYDIGIALRIQNARMSA